LRIGVIEGKAPEGQAHSKAPERPAQSQGRKVLTKKTSLFLVPFTADWCRLVPFGADLPMLTSAPIHPMEKEQSVETFETVPTSFDAVFTQLSINPLIHLSIHPPS